MLLAFIGCEDIYSDDDTEFIPTGPSAITSSRADWTISISPIFGGSSPSAHLVMLYCLNLINPPTSPTPINLKIDGSQVPMSLFFYIPGVFSGITDLQQGETYDIEFIYNNVLKVDTTIRIAYIPNANFPQSFASNQSAFLSWQLAGSNQYQFVGARSENESTDQDSDYVKQIEPNIRSYTIPANAVQDYGPGTEYTLGVDEVNFKVVNRIAVMSIASDARNYHGKSITNKVSYNYHKSKKILHLIHPA